MNPYFKLKKILFLGGGGGGWGWGGGEGARVSEFFTMNPNLKKKIFLEWGRGGVVAGGRGELE